MFLPPLHNCQPLQDCNHALDLAAEMLLLLFLQVWPSNSLDCWCCCCRSSSIHYTTPKLCRTAGYCCHHLGLVPPLLLLLLLCTHLPSPAGQPLASCWLLLGVPPCTARASQECPAHTCEVCWNGKQEIMRSVDAAWMWATEIWLTGWRHWQCRPVQRDYCCCYTTSCTCLEVQTAEEDAACVIMQ
jgi:hypothetical protein